MHRECFPKKGWALLNTLKPMLLKNKAILAGGTALSLQIGHRISVDLDFFTITTINVESVISAVRRTGQSFRVMAEGEEHVVLDIEGVKFSLFHYDYPFIDQQVRYQGINVAGILDIAAMKIIAISQRGTKRDFVDTYFILRDIPFYRVAEHMEKRFGKERVNPILIGKALVYFSDGDSNPEPEYIGAKVEWEKIKTFFRQHVKQFTLDLRNAVESSSGK
jgi:predicted nucleotidyltransferase component of viral defense system